MADDSHPRPSEPGWYPDPWSADGKGERYYDGKRWGTSERPLTRAAQTPTDIHARRRSPAGSPGGRRQLLTVVVIAAAVGGAVWFVRHRSSSDHAVQSATIAQPKSANTSTTIFGLLGVGYNRGDCVVWDQTPAVTQQTHVVSCSDPHLIEISGRVDLGNRFDHFPTAAEFDEVYKSDCAPQISALIGGPLDPAGRFGPSGIHPSRGGWDAGERTVWCGAVATSQQKPQVEYILPLFRGRVEGADQTLLEQVGTCWTHTRNYPVPCSAPHEWEVTGSTDLTGRASTPPADQDASAWNALVGDDCVRAARIYLGHNPTGDYKATSLTISPESWAAGRRKAECIVGKFANGKLVTSVGSAKT